MHTLIAWTFLGLRSIGHWQKHGKNEETKRSMIWAEGMADRILMEVQPTCTLIDDAMARENKEKKKANGGACLTAPLKKLKKEAIGEVLTKKRKAAVDCVAGGQRPTIPVDLGGSGPCGCRCNCTAS